MINIFFMFDFIPEMTIARTGVFVELEVVHIVGINDSFAHSTKNSIALTEEETSVITNLISIARSER